MGLFSYFADSFTDLSKNGFMPSEISRMEKVSKQYSSFVENGVIRDLDGICDTLERRLPEIKNKTFDEISPEELQEVYDCFGKIKNIFLYMFQELSDANRYQDANLAFKIQEEALYIRTKIISPKLHELFDKKFEKMGL